MKRLRPWLIPTALAAALIAALFISPALGGPSFLTAKKLKKKAGAIQVRASASKPVPAGGGEQLMLSADLRPGSYLVRSTLSVDRLTQGVVTCRLRIPGVAEDSSTTFADNPANTDEEESLAMETAGRITGPATVQLVCASSLTGTSIRYAEITAQKVPKLAVSGA
jgi:hypothetical protein